MPIPHTSDPDLAARHAARVTVVEQLWDQVNALQAQLRVELDALVRIDTAFPGRDYVADEVALLLAESPGTVVRWVDTAQRYLAFPAVVAQVDKGVAAGGWSLRHADALLDAITGLGLTPEVQEQVIDLVASTPDARTPYQVRKAAEAAVLVLDPEGAARRYDKAKADRGVGTVKDGAGATLFAHGTTGEVAALFAGIDALVGPCPPDDGRTRAQRRFDVLMDLVCGRLAPGQWQAVVVVSLALLNGDDVPAEVPGLGLITSREARELLAHASLRRAVVDENGHLISLDTHVQHPDTTPGPATQGETCTHCAGHTEQVDPTPAEDLDTQAADVAAQAEEPLPDDAAWAHQVVQAHDLLVDDAMTDFEAGLHALLDSYLPITLVPATATLQVELPARTHRDPDDGPSGGSGGGPGSGPAGGGGRGPRSGPSGGGPARDGAPPSRPSGPRKVREPLPPLPRWPLRQPEPAPPVDTGQHRAPSPGDEIWNDTHLDRTTDQIDPTNPTDPADPDGPTWRAPTYQREARPAPSTRAPQPTSRDTSSWTLPAQHRARTTLLTRPVETKPLTSDSYALPPRLARHIKTRDLTCTFPGCTRLARDCQNDHVIPWPQGPSTADNTRSNCTHHHQAKHHYFTVTATPDGGQTWTTPTDRTYLRGPRPLLRGW